MATTETTTTTKKKAVQCFGRKKTSVAVAYVKQGRGLIKVNGVPLELVEPEILRYKVFEPILLLGNDKFANVDIRVRVNGGGYTSRIYGKLFFFFFFLSATKINF